MNSQARRTNESFVSLRGLLTITLLLVVAIACAPATTTDGPRRAVIPQLAAYQTVLLPNIVMDDGRHDTEMVEPVLESVLRTSTARVVSPRQSLSEEVDFATALGLEVYWQWSGSTVVLELRAYNALGQEMFRVQERVNASWTNQTAAVQTAARSAALSFVAAYPGFDSSAPNPVRSRLANWPSADWTEEAARRAFESRESIDPVEGIWVFEDGNYRVVIVKADDDSSGRLKGYVLEADHPLFRRGMLKLELVPTATPGVYSTTYFMGDLSSVSRTARLDGAVLVIPDLPQNVGNVAVLRVFPPHRGAVGAGSGEGATSTVTGSGFLIASAGIVVTNAHVVDGRSEFQVQLFEGAHSYAAVIAVVDRANDLALLQLIDFDYDAVFSEPIPYALASRDDTAVGDAVVALGFPLSDVLGDGLRATTGIISARSGVQGAPNVFQISNPVQPGNSGGPLVNEFGEVVGVVVASLNAGLFLEAAGVVPQNVNFAVKSAYVRNLITMVPAASEALTHVPTVPSGATLSELIRAAQPFVASVEAR